MTYKKGAIALIVKGERHCAFDSQVLLLFDKASRKFSDSLFVIHLLHLYKVQAIASEMRKNFIRNHPARNVQRRGGLSPEGHSTELNPRNHFCESSLSWVRLSICGSAYCVESPHRMLNGFLPVHDFDGAARLPIASPALRWRPSLCGPLANIAALQRY